MFYTQKAKTIFEKSNIFHPSDSASIEVVLLDNGSVRKSYVIIINRTMFPIGEQQNED